MKRYQNALQQIKVELDFDTRDTTIYSIQYPNLKTLDLDDTAWWISRNVPVLQEMPMISRTLFKNGAALNTTPGSSYNVELQRFTDMQQSTTSRILHSSWSAIHFDESVSRFLSTLVNIGATHGAICFLRHVSSGPVFDVGILLTSKHSLLILSKVFIL